MPFDKSRRHASTRDRFRLNNRIRAREVRLIGDDGEQVGVISLQEAMGIAAERNLDLVEVAPNANPPVCRLMDYGKFRYEQSKKEREARKHQKQTELKEVRLRPKTDTHDLEVKANQARRFIEAGDKVKFTVRFRGREMAHTNIGREILDQLAERLHDISIVENKPSLEGRAISLVLAPNAKVLKAVHKAKQESKQSSRPETDSKKKSSSASSQSSEDSAETHDSPPSTDEDSNELHDDDLHHDHDDQDHDDHDHDDHDHDEQDQDRDDHDDDSDEAHDDSADPKA